MRITGKIKCADFPCKDIDKSVHPLPGADIDPASVQVVMIAESAPASAKDYFYAKGAPAFMETTLQAFNDAGMNVKSMDDILNLGVYITAAVKCAKTDYAISRETIANCSILLEQELDLFPNVKVIMLMGDVAIKAMNMIAKRKTGKAAIPAGSTYKIRKQKFYYGSVRVFPSYLMTGKNYLIEKSKRAMIAEDIRTAAGIIN
ncbi:MAG TPA: uracil-DNA glycosylase family protein [Ignavibacteriales bacterium]|nr:uracil-DNA glycosylase family protein [Ignavibacteriales bacterium]